MLCLPKRLTYIVGDLHGSVENLSAILSNSDIWQGLSDQTAQLLFLGDYIHHRKYAIDDTHSLQLIILLTELLDSFPEQVFLLRGNHDTVQEKIVTWGIQISERFNTFVSSRFGVDTLKAMGEFFDRLPVVGVGSCFASTHAAPPVSALTLNEITDLSAVEPQYRQMMWNRDIEPQHISHFLKALGLLPSAMFVSGHHATPDRQGISKAHRGNRSHLVLQSWQPEALTIARADANHVTLFPIAL